VSELVVRRATVADAALVTHLRTVFLSEIDGEMTPSVAVALSEATETYMKTALMDGSFLAWLGEAEGAVVATSGFIVQPFLPSTQNPSGLRGYIRNMYTVPAWRGRGAASALLAEIMRYAASRNLRRLYLHATEQGFPIYARARFVPHEKGALHGEIYWLADD